MILCDMLAGMDYRCLSGNVDVDVTDLIYDSRKVVSGAAFFCIDGVVTDGHSYAADAVEKGAAVLIVEHEVDAGGEITQVQVSSTRDALAHMAAVYFGRPADRMKVIGITGTKGKTSTAYMIKNIIENTGEKCGIIGTVGAAWGDKKVTTGLTTPESYVIHSLFKQMTDDGCGYVVMEVSSQALKMERTSGIEFDVAVFTNFSPDHIADGEHATLEEYRQCKEILFTQCKTGVFNEDDEVADEFIKHATCDDIWIYGLASEQSAAVCNSGTSNCIMADEVKQWAESGKLGISFDVSGAVSGHVKLEIPGLFNVYNAMAAVSVCHVLGIGLDDILKNLLSVRIPGRVELVNVSDEYSVIVDYAHNEVSTRSVMETLREYNPAHIICVYGGGGNRSKLRRYDMGEVTGELADLSVLTCDNPRDEEIESINNDIKVGLAKHNGAYVEVPDRIDAIEYAMRHAVKGDIVLLLGKGHEQYQEIKGVKYHYDEREAVMEAASRL